MGGANVRKMSGLRVFYGLSPRGRGKPMSKFNPPIFSRSIPAWAGQTGLCFDGFVYSTVYPRVGGANYIFLFSKQSRYGLSPRGRGKQIMMHFYDQEGGSIPAWAGQTGWLV